MADIYGPPKYHSSLEALAPTILAFFFHIASLHVWSLFSSPQFHKLSVHLQPLPSSVSILLLSGTLQLPSHRFSYVYLKLAAVRIKSCFVQAAWPTLPVIKTSRYLERFYWNLPEQHREVVNKKEDTWMIHGEEADCCLYSLWVGVLAVRNSDGGTLFLPESEVQTINKTIYTTEGWGHIKIIWSYE